MLCLVVLSVLGATAYMTGRIEVASTSQFKDMEQAFRNADGGARYVLSRIRADVAGGTLSLSGTNVSVSYAAPSGMIFDTVVSLSCLADGRSYKYTVIGRANGAKTAVEMAVTGGANPYGDFFSEGQMTFSGGSSATGSVACDVGITLSSSSYIVGDASPGPGYAVSAPSHVTGSTAPLSASVNLPQIDAGALADAQANNNNSTIPPAHYVSGNFSLGGGGVLTLSPGIYYFKKFTISGGASVILTGPTVIYCTGAFTVSGGSIDNTTANPDNLQIYCTSSDKVTYSGTSAGYANIYAPNSSEVVVSGGGTFNGSIASGGSLTVSGGSDLISGGTSSNSHEVKMVSWRQVSG
jgi:hypothetical protein